MHHHLADRCTRQTCDLNKACILAASSLYDGDWLLAAPITSVDLSMSDEMILVAMGYRLRLRTCEPHTCPCDKDMDARGLNGLSCRRSSARQQRHAQLNDIIWRAIKRAQIPIANEPVGLSRTAGKRPNGATLISWSREKPLVWNVTVPDTFAESHLKDIAVLAGAVAKSGGNIQDYQLHVNNNTHLFVPIAIDTSGAWNNETIEIVQEIGKRIKSITNDLNKTNYLFQRISTAIKRGNAVSFLNIYSHEQERQLDH